MDALILKDGVETRLSSIGLLVTDFKDSSPSIVANRREITNRSGYIFNGAVHKSKQIIISGIFSASEAYELEEKKDEINGLVSNDEPFYITKMTPTGEMYEFELPGDRTYDLDFLSVPHRVYKYRYKVIMQNEIEYAFLGKTENSLRMRFSMVLETAELPFGETIPTDKTITTTIDYKGTAKCSQLEWPWTVKLVSNATQSGAINLKIGDITFTYQAVTPLASGDVLLLKGVETTLNYANVNDKTNYEHFVLKPSVTKKITVTTNFKGTIQLLNFVELYK